MLQILSCLDFTIQGIKKFYKGGADKQLTEFYLKVLYEGREKVLKSDSQCI